MQMDNASTALQAATRRPRWVGDILEATRQSLLTRLRDHADHEGWQRFLETYGGVIHGLALKAGLSATEADEALQETLLSVAGEMPDFHYNSARGSFKGWLFLITRRRIADQFRKRARLQRHEAGADDAFENTPDPSPDRLSEAWEDEWRQNRLQLAVERVKQMVSPCQWQMFDLAALQACPMERITALLGVNRAQVYMAKLRIGRLLRREVDALPDE